MFLLKLFIILITTPLWAAHIDTDQSVDTIVNADSAQEKPLNHHMHLWTPLLHTAARSGLANICEQLCERGAYANVLDKENKTPLQQVLTNSYRRRWIDEHCNQTALKLIDFGARISIEDIEELQGNIASHDHYNQTARQLIDFGARISSEDIEDLQVNIASHSILFLILKMLVLDEPDIMTHVREHRSLSSLTPAHLNMALKYACTHLKHDRIVQLCNLGASPCAVCPNMPEKFGRTIDLIRHIASTNPNMEERYEYLAILNILNAQILERHYQLRPALCRASEPILPDELITHIMAYDTEGSLVRALLPLAKKSA